MMYHANRRLAATICETVEHVSPETLNPLPWPATMMANMPDHIIEAPAPSLPRGFDPTLAPRRPSEDTLIGWNVQQLGAGVFGPSETGHHGYISGQSFLGRITETVGHFTQAYPELLETELRRNGLSGALLEARIFINAPITSGEGYKIYSGVNDCNSHTRNLIHQMVNAVTGESVFSMLGIGCLFDLSLIHI